MLTARVPRTSHARPDLVLGVLVTLPRKKAILTRDRRMDRSFIPLTRQLKD